MTQALKLPILRKFTAALLVFSFFLLQACAPRQKHADEYYDVFDTYISFTAYTKNQRQFERYSDMVYGELKRLHMLFDIYNDYDGLNNIKTINDNAGISPVKVDGDIIKLVELSKKYYTGTNGVVNIALGPVLKMWHDHRAHALANPESASIPALSELEAAAKLCNINDVIVDAENSTVYLARKGMRLDVGSVAKGYAAGSAMALARDGGLVSGILNAGGNVVTLGEPQDSREHWVVGIQSPELDADVARNVIKTIETNDASVVTSGDYQRFYSVNDEVFHHIIDPKTLMPAKNYHSVTVAVNELSIESAMAADALSTAAFVLPRQDALNLVERFRFDAFWVLQNNGTFSTKGFV